MNSIFDADLLTSFPLGLKKDDKIISLAKVTVEQLTIINDNLNINIIYSNVDNIPENILDILAYDLKIDWYEYNWPIDVKKETIKNSIKVHKYLGTKYSLDTALCNLHPLSQVEEWHEYDGNPYFFRVVLDTTHSRVEVDTSKISNAIEIYKRLSTRVEEIIFQCTVKFNIETNADYYMFKTGLTDRSSSGKVPYRNVIGAIRNSSVINNINICRYLYANVKTGIKPYRNIIGSLTNKNIDLNIMKEKYSFNAVISGKTKAGEEPYRNTVGKAEKGELNNLSKIEKFSHSTKKCGMNLCKRR